jgi:hypothetical protein
VLTPRKRSACLRVIVPRAGSGGCGRNAMRGKGITGAAAGTSAGGTRDAAGALDAGWTVWMWQNRAPRLAVNAYNRYLTSSRDDEVIFPMDLLYFPRHQTRLQGLKFLVTNTKRKRIPMVFFERFVSKFKF